jgi:GNAT superfamily N-acetyltransferase
MIQILDGFDKMDFAKVTEMLATAYWSVGIGQDEIVKGASHSAIVVGAFADGEQVGYARAVSDLTRFAYIMDVYVDERFRRQGIGQRMINHMLRHEALKDVLNWVLTTTDAHGVYGKCGFVPLREPAKWMQKRKEQPN